MKDKILAMLNAKNTRKAELVNSIQASDSVEDIKRFSAELDTVNGEIRDLEGMINDIPDEAEARTLFNLLFVEWNRLKICCATAVSVFV